MDLKRLIDIRILYVVAAVANVYWAITERSLDKAVIAGLFVATIFYDTSCRLHERMVSLLVDGRQDHA
jgi:hypothetical protein